MCYIDLGGVRSHKDGGFSEDFYIHHSSFCIHHKKGAPSEPPKELWMDNVKRHLLSGDKLPGRESDVNFGGFAVGTDYFQPFYHDTADVIHRLFQFTELASGFVEVQGVDHRGNHDRHIAESDLRRVVHAEHSIGNHFALRGSHMHILHQHVVLPVQVKAGGPESGFRGAVQRESAKHFFHTVHIEECRTEFGGIGVPSGG